MFATTKLEKCEVGRRTDLTFLVHTHVIPTPKDFEELYDIYVPQRWNQLTEEERAELISKTMNGVLLPLVMMIDKNPSSGQINWSGQSHDVAWRCYDFGQKNRIWIQVGLLNSESGIGFGISK